MNVLGFLEIPEGMCPRYMYSEICNMLKPQLLCATESQRDIYVA